MALFVNEAPVLPDFRQYRLNRLRRRRYNAPTAPRVVIPTSVDHYTGNPDADPMDNNTVGDCVAADCGHFVNQMSWLMGEVEPVTDVEVLSFYTLISEYPTSDSGSDIEDALTAMAGPGLSGLTIDAWGEISLQAIKPAIAWMYGAHLSWELPSSAIQQSNAGQPWVPVPGATIAGGHETYGVGYSPGYLYVDTWGFLQPVSWSFVAKYCNFAAVTANQALIGITGQTAATLDNQYQQLTGSPRMPFSKPLRAA